ncbi:ArsR family transcriptional regulator [Rhodococcus sp. NPDC059968]|uniref:arsenate reductase/protein-tyrosine-phosphatase family protein n=1 Tax=Rhodococcus sp. NPDC059968 TaxID=3347017 RepID=UPI0036723242
MVLSRQPVPPFLQLAAHPLRWQLLATLSGGDYRVREMVTLVGESQNLISYHLRLLRDGGLVRATRSSFDGRDSYYHLDLDRCTQMLAGTGTALHPALGPGPAPPPFDPTPPVAVLFVCTGNSARSVIAEALLRRHTSGRVDTVSAGTRPKPGMHPNAVRVLREEFGIDIAGRHPRHLDTLADSPFDTVITLCDKAREVCPEFDDTRWIHWSIPDPAAAGGTDEDTYPTFQATAAEIDIRIRYLLPALTTEPVIRSAR